MYKWTRAVQTRVVQGSTVSIIFFCNLAFFTQLGTFLAIIFQILFSDSFSFSSWASSCIYVRPFDIVPQATEVLFMFQIFLPFSIMVVSINLFSTSSTLPPTLIVQSAIKLIQWTLYFPVLEFQFCYFYTFHFLLRFPIYTLITFLFSFKLLYIFIQDVLGEFPGSPVIRTLSSHCQGPGFDPWSGN